MVFNASFNNISVIWWQSVLLVEETGENHRQFSIVEDSVDYSKHYSMFGVLKFKKCLMYCEKVV